MCLAREGDNEIKQLNLQGQTKEQEAIAFIEKHEPPQGYLGGFSGGKDSVVLKYLTDKSGVKCQWYYSATGIDAPELQKFIKENYPDVIWKKPKHSFFIEIPKRGYPTKGFRWCCDFLKKEPTQKVPLKHQLMGIRAEESYKRAQRGRISKGHGKITYKPIFHWLLWEVWEYIESENLAYCSLYDEGFDRLGCVVCPFICNPGKGAQIKLQIHKQRWPKYYRGFEKAMLKWWDNGGWWKETKTRRAFLFDEFLFNWYRGK